MGASPASVVGTLSQTLAMSQTLAIDFVPKPSRFGDGGVGLCRQIGPDLNADIAVCAPVRVVNRPRRTSAARLMCSSMSRSYKALRHPLLQGQNWPSSPFRRAKRLIFGLSGHGSLRGMLRNRGLHGGSCDPRRDSARFAGRCLRYRGRNYAVTSCVGSAFPTVAECLASAQCDATQLGEKYGKRLNGEHAARS